MIADVIKKIRKDNGLTQKDLAQKLSVAPTSISAWERGYNKPLMDKISLMSEMFSVPIQDFFVGHEDELKVKGEGNDPLMNNLKEIEHASNNMKEHEKVNREADGGLLRLPLYGGIAAGAASVVAGIVEEDLEYISLPPQLAGKHHTSKDLFAMKVNGESMNKIIPNGSYVICKKTEDNNIKDNDIVIFSHDNAYSMKRYYEKDYTVIFKPESTTGKYDEIEIPKDTVNNLRIYAKVIGYSVVLN